MSDALNVPVPFNVEEERRANPPRYLVRFVCFGNMPHHRDPRLPIGHARNPVPPIPLPDSDWVMRSKLPGKDA